MDLDKKRPPELIVTKDHSFDKVSNNASPTLSIKHKNGDFSKRAGKLSRNESSLTPSRSPSSIQKNKNQDLAQIPITPLSLNRLSSGSLHQSPKLKNYKNRKPSPRKFIMIEQMDSEPAQSNSQGMRTSN